MDIINPQLDATNAFQVVKHATAHWKQTESTVKKTQVFLQMVLEFVMMAGLAKQIDAKHVIQDVKLAQVAQNGIELNVQNTPFLTKRLENVKMVGIANQMIACNVM